MDTVGSMARAPPSEFAKAFAGAVSGGMGGMVSAFVLFPLDVIKTRQQGGDQLGVFAMTQKLVRLQSCQRSGCLCFSGT